MRHAPEIELVQAFPSANGVTYSGCGAPVLVRRVSTKNIKMTKTARPTQKPITMESET